MKNSQESLDLFPQKVVIQAINLLKFQKIRNNRDKECFLEVMRNMVSKLLVEKNIDLYIYYNFNIVAYFSGRIEQKVNQQNLTCFLKKKLDYNKAFYTKTKDQWLNLKIHTLVFANQMKNKKHHISTPKIYILRQLRNKIFPKDYYSILTILKINNQILNSLKIIGLLNKP